MKDQLISFETAKLAKEKGFNEVVFAHYGDDGLLGYTMGKLNYSKNTGCSAPTQSLLQKWLREKHGVYAYVFISVAGIYIEIFNPNNKEHNATFGKDGGYITYEEALEVGLQEALKLI